MRAVSDEQLIEWVARGDASCLGTLFERHNRSVYQFCRQMTRQTVQSEDLVQEIFLKILRKAGSFRQQGSFKAWMFNIARNTTLDYLRQAKRRDELVPVDASTEPLAVDHRSAEVTAAGEQNISLLAKALANLPKTAGVFIRVSNQVPVGFAVAAIQAARDAGFDQVTYVPAQ